MPRDGDLSRASSKGRVEDQPAHNEAVRDINETLRGPVADVFRGLVPAFGDINGSEFYDMAMGNSDLLHGCIRIFRLHRDAFRALLVDARGRPVNDEFVRLRCGRSVHDIIAMIVRTHAKRHFKAVLGGDPNDPTTKAGRLYQAMNEYLIHDWQVPLVPHYAPMPLYKVREMGPRILDIREAELLDAITAKAQAGQQGLAPEGARFEVKPPPADEPATPPSSTTVVARRGRPFMPVAEVEVFSGTPQEEFWWQALTDRSVVNVLGQRSGHEMRDLVAVLAGVNESVRSELFAALSLSTFQAAVCLATAFKVLGRAGFAAIFGNPGKPALVATIAVRLRQRGVGSGTDLKALARIAESSVRP
jgi:hypothetical protein